MKITETRKAIIELIEPYMDKTLSEWCLVINSYSWEDKIDIILKSDDWGPYWKTKLWTISYDWWDVEKIWHYDITAVDSFIIWIWEELTYRVIVAWTKSKAVLDKNNNFIWNYPNKPLYLFTEKEDENLLKILHKLWNSN